MLEERINAMDPDENDIFKFLGIEHADGIKTKKVFERVKFEVRKRVPMLINAELNDANLVRAINAKVILVAAGADPEQFLTFANFQLQKWPRPSDHTHI